MLFGIRKRGSSIEQTVGDDNPLPVGMTGSGAQVYDGSAAWLNNAAANTVVNKDIDLPTDLQKDAKYLITVTNPSAESALTFVVKNKETFNTTARYPELTRFGVAANSADGRSVLVEGWMLCEGARLSVSNDSLIGAAGAFTSYIRIRKI